MELNWWSGILYGVTSMLQHNTHTTLANFTTTDSVVVLKSQWNSRAFQ